MRNKNYFKKEVKSLDPKTSNVFDAPVKALDYSMVLNDGEKAEI